MWDWSFDVDREAARRDVLEFGALEKREAAILLDYRTGERVGKQPITPGTGISVNVAELLRQARREGRTVVAVHNHSNGTPPSPQDVAVTVSWPGTLRETLVATPEGWHTLRPGPLSDPERPDRALIVTMEMMQAEMDAGLLSEEQWQLELKGFAVGGDIYHDYRRVSP